MVYAAGALAFLAKQANLGSEFTVLTLNIIDCPNEKILC